MVPGTAWVAEQRPLPWLRWLCGILVALVMRASAEPRIVADVGTTPIFNWILYGYGFRRSRSGSRAGCCASAPTIADAHGRCRRDPVHGADRASWRSATTSTRRHLLPSAALTEVALQVCGALALAIGLERMRARTASSCTTSPRS
jgi:uncharacterized membrane protein